MMCDLLYLVPTTISGKVDLRRRCSGVVVTLIGSSLDPAPSAITAADGSYTLSNIPLGDSGKITLPARIIPSRLLHSVFPLSTAI
jgi:hypothetical protein